jgi:parallel beta helix pectate lyase-like protein
MKIPTIAWIVGCAVILNASVASPRAEHFYNPRAFGARGDRVTDDTRAFQSAVNAGDLLIGRGTYLINGVVEVPSHRKIICDLGAAFLATLHNKTNTAILRFTGTSNGVVTGCTFEGTNISTPPGFDPAREWNFGILIWQSATDISVINNTFRHFWANAAVQVYGTKAQASPRHILIAGNIFESNGIYGAVLVSGSYNRVIYNRFVNCAAGLEPDDTGQQLRDNVFEQNLIQNDGNGRAAGVYMQGGAAIDGFDYTGNVFRDNTVTGGHTVFYITPPKAGRASTFFSNRCLAGCKPK